MLQPSLAVLYFYMGLRVLWVTLIGEWALVLEELLTTTLNMPIMLALSRLLIGTLSLHCAHCMADLINIERSVRVGLTSLLQHQTESVAPKIYLQVGKCVLSHLHHGSGTALTVVFIAQLVSLFIHLLSCVKMLLIPALLFVSLHLYRGTILQHMATRCITKWLQPLHSVFQMQLNN